MMKIFPIILSIGLLLITKTKCETSVYIFAENMKQAVTSSTLQWISSVGLNETLLENAVVAAYQITEEEDRSDTQDTTNTITNKPVYICRAKVNTVWVSGQLRPKKSVCVVSMYKTVTEHTKFEVLINIEDSARLSWVHKDKYSLCPEGAVFTGDSTLSTFIARRSVNNNNKQDSLTHYIGKYDNDDNLGVFKLVDQNNKEIGFEDGEILVETEPKSYELKSIKYLRKRNRHISKRIELGSAILKNTEGGVQRVDTVISYTYKYSLYWGKGHGLLTGLPLIVHLSNGTNLDGKWAITETSERIETKTIETYLDEGTAVNVTLYGNYTESDIPYKAFVVAIYKDDDHKERSIYDSKREHTMYDVYPEFGPVYYLHNNSHVPTTTSTTTTTTTTTTSRTTSTTTQQEQKHDLGSSAENIQDDNNKKEYKNPNEKNQKYDNHSVLSDQGNNNYENDNSNNIKRDPSSLTGEGKKKEVNSSSTIITCNLITLFITAVIIRRVT